MLRDLISLNLTVDILERDDELGTVIVGFAENILPGPATAIDETAHQNVSFSLALWIQVFRT